jgi:transcriptional regulator with GAF, ATPase, and Fis domain
MSEQELQALLARVAVLESKNAELENKFGELETQMDTVNKFISAITESQSLENTMNEIESVTKQLTNCDKAAFYCYDNTNGKFFSQGDYRSWQDEQSAEELKNAFDSKDILSDGKEAVIPLVSSSGNSVGVIVAEKSDGFTKEDYDNFKPGCQIVNTVELAMKKEFEHQGRITDELTHLKNRQGLILSALANVTNLCPQKSYMQIFAGISWTFAAADSITSTCPIQCAAILMRASL